MVPVHSEHAATRRSRGQGRCNSFHTSTRHGKVLHTLHGATGRSAVALAGWADRAQEQETLQAGLLAIRANTTTYMCVGHTMLHVCNTMHNMRESPASVTAAAHPSPHTHWHSDSQSNAYTTSRLIEEAHEQRSIMHRVFRDLGQGGRSACGADRKGRKRGAQQPAQRLGRRGMMNDMWHEA